MSEEYLLTADEVERLPEGTWVRVIWSGGNGPHEYRIVIDQYGQRYAVVERYYDDPNDRLRWYNPLTFVGVENFNTRVWLLDEGART